MTIIRKMMGAYKHWGEDENIGMFMTLFNHESSFPPFLPVICRIADYESHKPHGGTVQCVNFFPAMKGVSVRGRQHIQCDNIIEMDPLHIIDDRLVLPIDKFKFNKMSKIDEFVKTNGAITFQLNNLKHAASLMENFRKLSENYKHTAVIERSTGGSRNSAKDTIVTYLSFYDLPYAIPVYNNKKANGLGIHLMFMWDYSTEKSGSPHYTGEIFVATNQYPDNLLFVDGQKAFPEGQLGNDYIAHFRQLLEKESVRQKDNKKSVSSSKKVPATPEKKKESGAEKEVRFTTSRIRISNPSGYYHSGTSSTTTTYT